MGRAQQCDQQALWRCRRRNEIVDAQAICFFDMRKVKAIGDDGQAARMQRMFERDEIEKALRITRDPRGHNGVHSFRRAEDGPGIPRCGGYSPVIQGINEGPEVTLLRIDEQDGGCSHTQA